MQWHSGVLVLLFRIGICFRLRFITRRLLSSFDTATIHHEAHSSGRRNHNHDWNEGPILNLSSRKDMVTGLNVSHGDALSLLLQRGVLIGFNGLRDSIWTQDRHLGWIE